jgi:hypothetical protein
MTLTIRHPRTDHRHLFVAGAAIALTSIVGVVTYTAVDDGGGSGGGSQTQPAVQVTEPQFAPTAGVADWARSNQMTGISPAGLHPTGTVAADPAVVLNQSSGASGVSLLDQVDQPGAGHPLAEVNVEARTGQDTPDRLDVIEGLSLEELAVAYRNAHGPTQGRLEVIEGLSPEELAVAYENVYGAGPAESATQRVIAESASGRPFG